MPPTYKLVPTKQYQCALMILPQNAWSCDNVHNILEKITYSKEKRNKRGKAKLLLHQLEPHHNTCLPHCELLLHQLEPHHNTCLPHCELLLHQLEPLHNTCLPHCEFVCSCSYFSAPIVPSLRDGRLHKSSHIRIVLTLLAQIINHVFHWIRWSNCLLFRSQFDLVVNYKQHFYTMVHVQALMPIIYIYIYTLVFTLSPISFSICSVHPLLSVSLAV